MDALAPKKCSRCRTEVTADDPRRPEFVSGKVYTPANPRPTLGDKPVWWEVESDYEQHGTIAALLCASCAEELTRWIHLNVQIGGSRGG